MLGAILHITDIQFDHDYETDGVYIVHEEMLEMGIILVFHNCIRFDSCDNNYETWKWIAFIFIFILCILYCSC